MIRGPILLAAALVFAMTAGSVVADDGHGFLAENPTDPVLIQQSLEDDPVPPPQNFQGEYNETTREVLLTWEPPDNQDYTYHVYRNGTLLATTTHLEHRDHLYPGPIDEQIFAVYWVTASLQGSNGQSAPTDPFLVAEGPICTPVGVSYEPDEFPYLHTGTDQGCIRGLKAFVERLITGGSPVDKIIDMILPSTN